MHLASVVLTSMRHVTIGWFCMEQLVQVSPIPIVHPASIVALCSC
jgi:hypothetical protein